MAGLLTGVMASTAAAQDPSPTATPIPDVEPNGVYVSDPAVLAPDGGFFPAGEPGVVSVVAMAPAEDGESLLVVVRNNTTEANLRYSAVAVRVLDGDDVVALGTSASSMPHELSVGGLGLFVVPFDEAIDANLLAEPEIRVSVGDDGPNYGAERIDVLDVVPGDEEVLIGLANGGGLDADFVDVVVACLSPDGGSGITSWLSDEAVELTVPDGRAASLTLSEPLTDCDGPVVGAARGAYA